MLRTTYEVCSNYLKQVQNQVVYLSKLKTGTMVKSFLKYAACIAPLTAVFAFSSVFEGAIKGTVVPAAGANMVMAISGKDTISSPITDGTFFLAKVKPGTYSVWFKGVAPFKDTPVEGVAVVEGSTTDLGEVKLQQ
jgi:hypothetical protein